MRSTAGLKLAMDVIERHGDKALLVLDECLAKSGYDPEERAILKIARRETAKLLASPKTPGADHARKCG